MRTPVGTGRDGPVGTQPTPDGTGTGPNGQGPAYAAYQARNRVLLRNRAAVWAVQIGRAHV